jgi:hypothetical protein
VSVVEGKKSQSEITNDALDALNYGLGIPGEIVRTSLNTYFMNKNGLAVKRAGMPEYERFWADPDYNIKEVEMAQEQKKKKGDEASPFSGLNYEVPKNKELLESLDQAYKETLKDEHAEMMKDLQDQGQEEDEKQDKGSKAKKKQQQGRLICCCGVGGCRIGPMEERYESMESKE